MPRAPSARAMARPTRRPAPVTSTTRPTSLSAPSGGWGTAQRREALVLPSKPLCLHAHHADRARPFGGTVPVRPTARDETELLGQRTQARGVLRRVAGM